MSGNIIVGTDESAPSRAATSWALDHSGPSGSEVVLTHVMTADDSRDAGASASAAEHLADHAAVARSAFPHVRVSTNLRVGDALGQLIECSAGASALVMGTHKTGFVQGRVFGSRYMQLAAAAHCPVIFVPSGSRPDVNSGVVVGVDDAQSDRAALLFASDKAAATGSRLTLVHCWALSEIAGETPSEGERRSLLESIRAEKILAEAGSIVRATHPAVLYRTRSIRRPGAEGLIDASASALLLVLGQGHTREEPGRVVGHTVHDVLVNLVAPTAIVAATATPDETAR